MLRRQFVARAGAAALLPASSQAWGQAPRAPRRTGGAVRFDAQGVIGEIDRSRPGLWVASPRVLAALRGRPVDVISMTVGPVGNASGAFQAAVEAITAWDRLIAQHPALLFKVERTADMRAAKADGRIGLILNFQDTSPLEADASRVDTFATLDVKVIQLTYNKRNLAGDGCLERSNAGLSDFGRDVIARINAAGVVLDLSHAGQRTTAEGIAASTAPPAITHSGCRALVDLPRNMHDAEMRALADKGGVFGVYLMPFLRTTGQPGTADLLRHLTHAINVCGEDGVGIGTDNPLMGYTIDDQARAAQRRFYEERAARGIAAPGEAADVFNMVEGYNTADRFERIGSDLRRAGWSTGRIEKVLGENFVRLFGEVWKA